MEKAHNVSLEIAGPAAMFTRPDTGSTPVSYPAPTFSAAKGMFEAVVRLPYANNTAWIHPTHIEICRPIRYERYVTNYGGPLRKQGQITNNNNYQLIATILVDVCYRIYGEIRTKRSTRGKGRSQLRQRHGSKDCADELRRIYKERIENGQTFYTPCLGWKEFVPSYFGPFREGTKREESVDDIVIPSFLRSMWDHRQLRPEYVQDWRIIRGVMSYSHQTPAEEVPNAE